MAKNIPGLEDYLITQITADAYRVGISGATIIGAATDSVTVAYGGDTLSYLSEEYVVPATNVKLPFGWFGDLADINFMPLMAPQLTQGLNARLGIVNWNIDYSLAAYPAISTGVNLAF